MDILESTIDVDGLNAIQVITAASQFAVEQKQDKVVHLYRSWLDKHPGDPSAYAIAFNLGVALKDAGEGAAAEVAYRQAVTLNPNCLEAQFNLGSQLEQLGRPHEAVIHWQEMLESGRFALPKDNNIYQLTLNNLGRLLEILKKYDVAEQMLTTSLLNNPDQPDALQHLIYLRQKQCKWPVYKEIRGVDPDAMFRATGTLSLLAATPDPAQQLSCAQRFARNKIVHPQQTLASKRSYNHSRLRVGYLSSDYCLHPVSMLTVELFELHDRERFEIYGFCWSRDDGSSLRKRVIDAFDRYLQIGDMSDEEAAKFIHSLKIDVLVDLHGLTLGARPNILAYRPAPVQMTYLGFPGSTAIPEVDYVLADRFVLPETEARFFTEKPLYLSSCFQVSDRQRPVGTRPTRASCDLPEDSFVFCSFNNNYKFTPEVFSVWMRILKRVTGSVLWLLADNEWAKENLCQAAEAAGVSCTRLIFAGRVAPADYLARYQIADLFLDTFPFGAGTTANDALWQGLPLLTCPGRSFASRMAGSLLNTLGVTELIAENWTDYEEKAVAIGNDPERAFLIRSYIKNRIQHSALFDIPSRSREIEEFFIETVNNLGTSNIPSSLPVASPYDLARLNLTQYYANYANSTRRSKISIEIVSATRLTQEKFWTESALGLSLLRLAKYTNLIPSISFENRRGLPEVYNERIRTSDAADILLFVHDDVWIDDYFLTERLLSGLAQYDMIGIAGNRWLYDDQPGWAFINDRFTLDHADNLSGIVAHGNKPFGDVTSFGITPTECELLDGVFLAVWKRILQTRNIFFDTRFNFHFYDLDFCRVARRQGLRLGTWPICVTHQSLGAFDTDEWKIAYSIYREKWATSG